MIEPDYSTFRKLMKHMQPEMSEVDVYQRWKGVMEPGWNVQTSPAPGYDDQYHFVYLTECLDDGRIYLGKHSTYDLNDGYQGSGYEVRDGLALGKKYKTTPLEFFKTSDDAYSAEAMLVNSAFLRSPLVLNRVPGGMSDEDGQPREKKKNDIPDLPAVPQKPTPYRSGRKSKKGTTFSELGVPVGEEIEYVKNSNIRPVVLNDWKVKWEDEDFSLTALMKVLNGGIFSGNPLNFFLWKGKNLGEIQKGLKDDKKP